MREYQDNHYRGYDDQRQHDRYVEKIHWLVRIGREDLIDEIAVAYERPPGPHSARQDGRPNRHLRSVS